MKFFRISILLAVFCFSAALTPYEATLYGSRILVCEPGAIIKHWTAFKSGGKGAKDEKNFVFDMKTKQTYPFGKCELYRCGPEPDRMKDCRMDAE